MSSKVSANVHILFFTKPFRFGQTRTDGIKFSNILFEASSGEGEMEEREGWCVSGSVSAMNILLYDVGSRSIEMIENSYGTNDGATIAQDGIAIAKEGISMANDGIAIVREGMMTEIDEIAMAGEDIAIEGGEIAAKNDRTTFAIVS